jgi:hypothetical protein
MTCSPPLCAGLRWVFEVNRDSLFWNSSGGIIHQFVFDPRLFLLSATGGTTLQCRFGTVG